LQLRRAHIDLSRRNGSAALTALRAIPLSGTPPLILMMVLDDRIALGDAAVVEAALNNGLLANLPAQRAVLEAHVDWKRGDSTGAIARLDEAATIAEANHAFTVATNAREMAALYAYASDAPSAATRLVAATKMLNEDSMVLYITDLKALAAELNVESGQPDVARRLLDEAKANIQFPEQRLQLEILNARLKAFPANHFATDRDITDADWHQGEGHLVKAWLAYSAGNLSIAQAEHALAQGANVRATFFAESALLLSAILSSKDDSCEVDPPYPFYFRLSDCRALSKITRLRRGTAKDS
jgi:hypothetical protein